jgi:hypothetical protein
VGDLSPDERQQIETQQFDGQYKQRAKQEVIKFSFLMRNKGISYVKIHSIYEENCDPEYRDDWLEWM